MASKQGKPLVIVESPAKARTIKKFLGSDYVIEASVGHVRDLPARAAEVPAKFKKEKWSRLGIDIENDFAPLYVVPPEKKEQIKRLEKLAKEATCLYLATDEDREGESISWHLREVLKPGVETHRLVFHEITKKAILAALQHPRSIDEDLVEAQEARRLVDRLFGYLVSPLLWKKIRPKLSAGRVQSVAVRLVVERERRRMRFVSTDYWDLLGTFQPGAPDTPEPQTKSFEARLVSRAGRRVAVGKDFDPDTGQLAPGDKEPLHLTEDAAQELAASLAGQPAAVESVEKKPIRERPAAPFTTSTLQQEAGRKLRFTAQRTMRAAQRLYENGHITYMRTDSTTLSQEAIDAARTLISSTFGPEYLPDAPREYTTKVRNAQEAHEAIRPAGASFVPPDDLGADMKADERRLYELIYKRAVASQMKDATGYRTTLRIGIENCLFQASGKTIEFPGFRRAYVEHADENGSAEISRRAEEERILPAVKPGDEISTLSIAAEGHATQPPARLTEASLVREMETRGIGRPSTYASIIETIQARDYCFKKGSALVPTFTAFAVTNLLEKHLQHLVDYAFTARMEDDLDEISHGRKARLGYLRAFYAGNGEQGLKQTLERAEAGIDPREVCTIDLGEDQEGTPIRVRVGRYGPYLECGEGRAQIPDGLAPDELTQERAREMLAKAQEGPRSLGSDPETGLSVHVKVGRFGPYFQLGDPKTLDGEKPKMASLLDGMDPETVTLEDALSVLGLPRVLGSAKTPDGPDAPGKDEPILAANGRFGPYVKWGKETRSIPDRGSPLEITLEQAKELLARPKARGRSGRAAQKVLRELGKHPQSDADVRLLDGRYGPYVTDGTTNASLPRGEAPDDLDMDRAIELLAARAARGPAKRKSAKKARPAKAKSAKKSPSKSSASGSKATKKKVTKTAKAPSSKSKAAKSKRTPTTARKS